MKTKNMYETILQQALLNKEQAIVYSALIKNGPLPASQIAKKTPLKRSLVYKVLDQLIEAGLVEKQTSQSKITIFRANHPTKLHELAQKKEAEAQSAQAVLGSVMANMVSEYNLVHSKPGIQFFEGVDGLKKIYDDILETGENFYLVRSGYEPVYVKEIVPIINKFIEKRVAKGMSVTALTPRDKVLNIKGRYASPKEDKKILFNRIWLNKNDYDAPVEIDIYGNKVAFLSFGKELIGVIIDSPQIARSLKKIFLLSKKAAKQLGDN